MPETPLISFVIPCKGRLSHLQQSLPRALAQPDSEVIVVDYDCPDGTAAWVAEHHPDAIVEKVEDQPFFHGPKARNAGLARAAGDWVFFLDSDILISPSLVSDVRSRLAKGRYFVFGKFRRDGVFGSNLTPRATVKAIGGYDEAFDGYGGADKDYFTRLNYVGLQWAYLPNEPEHAITHTPAERIAHYPDKTGFTSLATGRLYNIAKRDLMKATGTVRFPPDLLQTLRQKCWTEVERVMDKEDQRISLKIELPPASAAFEGYDEPDDLVKRVLIIETKLLSY